MKTVNSDIKQAAAEKAAKKIEQYFKAKFGYELKRAGHHSSVGVLYNLLKWNDAHIDDTWHEWDWFTRNMEIFFAEANAVCPKLLEKHFGSGGAEELPKLMQSLHELLEGVGKDEVVRHEMVHHDLLRNWSSVEESESIEAEYDVLLKVHEFEQSLRQSKSAIAA